MVLALLSSIPVNHQLIRWLSLASVVTLWGQKSLPLGSVRSTTDFLEAT